MAAARKVAFGYPNLRDNSWLWGDGTLDAIHQTILHGIRADDPETRTNQMPAFGRTGILSEPQIADVAEYALSLVRQGRRSGGRGPRRQDLRGQLHAVSRRRRQGEVERSVRPISPTSFGSMPGDKATVMESIRNGRGGVMPTWATVSIRRRSRNSPFTSIRWAVAGRGVDAM